MKLSAEQVQYLFAFTEKKYVKYYDLQIELVDHLAERIEEEMTANNNIRFETALQKVYSDFGIFGFAKVVQEKEEQVVRAGKKRLWREVNNLFRWPEVTMVACVTIVTWQLTVWVSLSILFPVFCGVWLISNIFLVIKISRDIRKQKKKLLIIQFSPTYFHSIFFLFEWTYISNSTHQNQWVFIVVVTLAVLLKLAAYRAYKNIRTDVAVMYPEAFAS